MTLPEKASRALYVAELIIFAVIPVYALTAWALLYGLGSLFMLFPMSYMLVVSIFDGSGLVGEALGYVALYGAVALLAGMGAIAILKFLYLSAVFAWHGTRRLQDHRQTYWRCIALSALPLVTINVVVAIMPDDARPFLFFASGLTLCVPLFHLWAELRYRSPPPQPVASSNASNDG